MKGERVLITGASGFIGRHLIDQALARGLDVYAGVRATSDRTHLIDGRISIFPFDMWDQERLYTDLKLFQEVHGGFQYVIHNAAVNKPNDLSDFVLGNADFTREFARMLLETQTDLRKFVYMSSMAAIGPGSPETMHPIDERHARRPITPYGHSKLLAERYLHEIETLPYVILRPTGVYGPGDTKFVLRVIAMLKRGVEVTLGPSEQQLSFIHVGDVARVAMQSCSMDVYREDFNISDGSFYRQQEFTAILKEVLGVRALRVRIPAPVLTASGYISFRLGKALNRPVHLSHLKMREVTAQNWKVDIAKARRMLRFEPVYNLRSGLVDVVESLI